MTFSSLIAGTLPHHGKYSSRYGKTVDRLIQHHWAGIGGGIERLTNPTEQASATYIITSDGSIWGQVPEEFQPWTSSSPEADGPSVTIEVQNCGGAFNGDDNHPSAWPITSAAYASVVNLLADVATRHGWDDIDETTYLGHRQFHTTACPGGYLWSRMAKTRAAANSVRNGRGVAAQGYITPIKLEEDDLFTDQSQRQLDTTLDDAHRSRGVLDSIEQPLHDKLLNVNRWVKSDTEATIYEIVNGKLRGMTALEWELLGSPKPAIFKQSKIDEMPKVPKETA